jgi:hypothetical protein
MSTPGLVYRSNEWVWWRAAVESYRLEWIAARQALFDRDMAELIGTLAELMGGKP